jgi:adenosylmethionine-8-amino-7-oxononanoate aminotransferase
MAKVDCPRLLADDCRNVWHPYTPLVGAAEPLACIGAHDEFLELVDGRRVIDAISSWWTILHGHRHPPLMQALAEAERTIDHVLFAGVTHPYAVELADLLLGTMPWFGGRVFYSDNGSTAVEVALKMAYQFWCHRDQPGRTRFVGFEHGYHGDTFGSMAVSRDPVFFGRFEPLLFRADILPLDPDRLNSHLERHAQQIAAVLLEPLVQGAGGMHMHSAETLRRIVEIVHRHGTLFIADEVMTGGGRTGTLWAHQAAGVVPDLVCAAKTLTGGILPLATTLASPRMVEAFLSADRQRTLFHGHSFTANPLACAVAACNYRQLLARPSEAAERIEKVWQSALQPLREYPPVKDVRIRGSIAAVEVDTAGGYLSDAGEKMRRRCLELGVFLRPLGSVLYAIPPYCTSADSLARIADAMVQAVKAL